MAHPHPPIVYLIRHDASGKGYVGATRCALQRRWRGHVQVARKGVRSAIAAAIRKYGEHAFSVRPLASALSVDTLEALETSLIAQHHTLAPGGFNLTSGGYGARGLLPETRALIGAKLRGRKHTDEAKRLIGEGGRGRVVSPETRAKISAGHAGKRLTEEHRAKLSAAKVGRSPIRTEAGKARLRENIAKARLAKVSK